MLNSQPRLRAKAKAMLRPNSKVPAKLFLGTIFVLSVINPTLAQITPNGAGTVVNSQGNQINITGGTQAGANLFHSFRDFNVNSSQIASFLSNPQTQNILARINGGNPSFINGLLQVTGGNSHLFLMNPAGIIFGQGVSLNVPASFTATTANQIGFGNALFNALGDNNFSALIGNPNSFIFNTTQTGSIVNAGNLAVGNNQNISLIAGNTINTGRLTAPGGEIQVLAVPGTDRVRLSQPGQVLSLEFVPPVNNEIRAVDLPALLTGRDLPGIQVNPTGQVQVAGTTLPNQQGVAVASGRIDVSSSIGNGGVVQVLGNRVAVLDSRINANGATGGGTVRLGGEYLGGRDTGIAPALRFNSQRTVVDRNSLIRVNATSTGDGGRVIVWADENTGYFGRITGRGATGRGGFAEVSGRENLAFDGRVELPGVNGLFGTLLLDPLDVMIVTGTNGSGTGDTTLVPGGIIAIGDPPPIMTISTGALAMIASGTAINITASGNISFNPGVTVNLLGSAAPAPVTLTAATLITPNPATLNTNGRSLTLNAVTIDAPNLTLQTQNNFAPSSGNINITASGGTLRLANLNTANGGTNINSGSVTLSAANGPIIITNAIVTGPATGFTGGNINLAAQANISSATSIGSQGGAININSSQGNITISGSGIASNTNTGINGGAITLSAPQGNITSTQIDSRSNTGNGGVISLTAQGNINFPSGQVLSSTNTGNAGAINFTSNQGNITTNIIQSLVNTSNGNGGAVTLNAPQGSITAGAISTIVSNGNGAAGAVNLTSLGNIVTNDITTYTDNLVANGGVVNLTSQGGITTGNIVTSTTTGNGGAVNLNAPNGNIVVNSIYTPGGGVGYSSGAVNVNAGNLFRAIGSYPSCPGSSASICTFALGGASDGTVTIRHGGGTITPFTIGDSAINGTALQINAGITSNILPTFIVPVTSAIYSRGIVQIITNIPPVIPPVTIAPVIIPLLANPEPPPTPPSVIVGTLPEPVVETPLPLPSPVPLPIPSPIPTPIPSPLPIPTPSPSPTIPSLLPSPTPSISSPLRTSLTGVNTNPQLPSIASEPLPGNLTFITNPTSAEISPRLNSLEESFQSEFQQYLGVTSQLNAPQTLQETQVILNQINQSTGVKPGLMYVFFAPPGGDGNFSLIDLSSQTNRVARDTDILEAVVITGTGEPVRVRLPGTTRRQVLEVANNFRSEVTNFRSPRGFLNSAQQMYKWLLEPLEEELQKQGIDNLVFLMDAGLRSIPLAAMHDGKGFIVERYSVGLMPSLNLTPLDHKPLEGSQVLAMGATTFGDSGLNPLPAVFLELNTISQLWEGSEFLNENFTLNNLIQQRQNRPFRMIHLATHGVFNPGDRSNSYIQFWDQRLSLDKLSQLSLGEPPVDLLVLSACQTALGDKDAELGFAGLAINAGVRSALASLWEVNDAATLGLMTKFYQQLQVTTTKAEALRQAQLAMLRGEVRLENGNLVTPDSTIPLTEELKNLGNLRLTHPYFWSAFTLVGNPW